MKPLTVLLALVFAAAFASAQDPVKIAPDMHKILLENDHARVYEFSAKPGAKLGMHSHTNHIVYAVTGGKVRFTTPDGKTTEVELPAGTARWADATTHIVENIGKADMKAIVIELKEKKATDSMKKK